MSKITDSLKEYGFSQNEISLYLFLLSNQDEPAYNIARETSIPRTTVYKTLESLRIKGFVSSWIKNGVKHYSTENPETLRRKIEEKKERIEEILPDLANLFSAVSVHPSAKLYQGKNGVKQVFEYLLDSIKTKKYPYVYAFSDSNLTDQFPKFFRSWRNRKNKTGVFTRLIVPFGTPMNIDYSSDTFRETRILPETFQFTGAIDIYGPLVILFSFKEKEVYSIVIESKIIADMLTQFFMYIWNTLDDAVMKQP